MALNGGDVENFNTLVHAAKADRLVLVESRDKATGEYRALVSAINIAKDGTRAIVPIAVLVLGNPYDEYMDPIEAARAGEWNYD